MDRDELLLEQWKMAAELHRHGNEVTWNRFNYFITMNGVLASASFAIYSSSERTVNELRIPLLLLFLFGFIVSLTWFLAHWRGEVYNHYRQNQAKAAELAIAAGDAQILSIYTYSLECQKLVTVPFVFKKWPILTVYKLIRLLSGVIAASWFVLAIWVLVWRSGS